MGWPCIATIQLAIVVFLRSAESTTSSEQRTTAGLAGNVLASQRYVRMLQGNSDLTEMLHEANDLDMVLFYVHWCSHCQKYVPKLIKFAEDIQGWWPVLHIGAIDCYDNAETCSEYGVNAYPTLELFWKAGREPKNQEGTTIDTLTGAELRAEIIRFIEKHIIVGVPSSRLPDLNPTSVQRVSDLWLSMPSSVEKILAVVEENSSYVGMELILDLSGIPNVRGVRFLVGQTPAELSHVGATSLIFLERTQEQRILVTTRNATEARRLFQEQLQEIGIRPQMPNLQPVPAVPTQPSKTSVISIMADPHKVYVDDVETGLRYMLQSELTLVDEFNSTQLDVLRTFIGAVALYVPLPDQINSYLRRVTDLLIRSQAPLTAAKFQWILENATKGFSFREVNYLGCKGSEPNKRGYPCSLWIMFHLMTVGCYRRYLQGDDLNPYKAIRVVRDYVLNFFTCKNCVGHFSKAAADLESELNKPGNGVLWLWKTHNDVNIRLKGDASEDPQFPKELFPNAKLCTDCQDASGKFKPWRVLDFLVEHYGPGNIYDGRLRQRAFDWVPISIILILLGVLTVIVVIICRIPRAEDIEKYVEVTTDIATKTEGTGKSSSGTTDGRTN